VSQLDNLPADQRAVLSLVLRQGKSYGDVAALLRINEAVVANRAYAALDALGPIGALDEELREEIADYLLGQQTASEREATRHELAASDTARAWARIVAAELRPLAGDSLPEVPTEGREVEQAFQALQERGEAEERQQRSSRLGGALMLGALGVAVAAIVVFVVVGVGGGSSSSSSNTGTPSTATSTPSTSTPAASTPASTTTSTTTSTPATTSTSTSTSTSTTPASSPQVEAQLTLVGPSGSSAKGAAIISRQGSQQALALVGQGLPATSGFAYAVWLYNSSSSAYPLGFAGKVTGNGKLSPVAAYLPSTASKYHQVIVTRETSNHPTHPGPIVLSASLPSGKIG
jgi:hypothetical protein